MGFCNSRDRWNQSCDSEECSIYFQRTWKFCSRWEAKKLSDLMNRSVTDNVIDNLVKKFSCTIIFCSFPRLKSFSINDLISCPSYHQVHHPESPVDLLLTYQVMWSGFSSFLWMTPSLPTDIWLPGSTTWDELKQVDAARQLWQCGGRLERATIWLDKLSLHQLIWPIRARGFSTFTIKW